jgi:hypothetical protein
MNELDTTMFLNSPGAMKVPAQHVSSAKYQQIGTEGSHVCNATHPAIYFASAHLCSCNHSRCVAVAKAHLLHCVPLGQVPPHPCTTSHAKICGYAPLAKYAHNYARHQDTNQPDTNQPDTNYARHPDMLHTKSHNM